MTLGEKLAKLRKENNYTQEQFADILGVSRQSISKWESNTAYPETDKLIKISELFHCTTDYLLKDEEENTSSSKKSSFSFKNIFREHKSKKIIWGMPLWCISSNAKGVFAIGLRARGIVTLGLLSEGVLPIGGLCFGAIPVGFISFGLISLGLFSLGMLAFGSMAAGIVSFGAISCGILSFGALTVGDFSLGALAFGKYFALGDSAHAMIAIGATEASGSAYNHVGSLQTADIDQVRNLLDANVPFYLGWAKKLLFVFLR